MTIIEDACEICEQLNEGKPHRGVSPVAVRRALEVMPNLLTYAKEIKAECQKWQDIAVMERARYLATMYLIPKKERDVFVHTASDFISMQMEQARYQLVIDGSNRSPDDTNMCFCCRNQSCCVERR